MELRSEASSNGTGAGVAQLSHLTSSYAPNVDYTTTTTEEPMKRKRGRPRKCQSNIGGPPLAVSPLAASAAGAIVVSESLLDGDAAANVSSLGVVGDGDGGVLKKARGRPLGSLNKKKKLPVVAPGSAGVGFTPHIIAAKAGEDIYSKIMTFSQNCPHTVCILSANGAISNVTLHQSATSGGTVTYEGCYEILSLSGSFSITSSGGQRSRTGGLSVSLAGSDGRVLGGLVAGLLTAASPVQVIVASFITDENREIKHINYTDLPTSAPSKLAPVQMTGISSPSTQGIFMPGASGSTHNQGFTAYGNSQHQTLPHVPWKQG